MKLYKRRTIVAKSDCPNLDANLKECSCSYPGCPRKGRCCECLQYHLKSGELPGCCFPADVERSYDRSMARFVASRSG
ncbi:MAG: cytosolic protein [Armatimonadetes bacterium]|nr:cytosolic protein [Armatimonadota bacterium]NIO74605.1 cytosolic protein [Armatimonadota bacterium]NIO96560.1 cytosolic protein [Armatimonadota bacterium]